MSASIESCILKLKQDTYKHFEEFYDLTKVGVFYTIKKICFDRSLIEDVMQDTYLLFLRNLHKIDLTSNPYSYLLTIAHNTAINKIKSQKPSVNVSDYENIFQSLPQNGTPLLNLCQNKLKPDDWKIIELCIVYGYKRVEVAKMLNKPISTINWQYNNCLKQIKNLYKEVYDEK
ncbi:MAG: sigma-70 family RNA polymerase sigma factor [Clostridia bacterium]